MLRIVVIGGGISGLACARGIVDQLPDAEVTILEAAENCPVSAITVIDADTGAQLFP